MIDVKRLTCKSGEVTRFQLQGPSVSFRVKNFCNSPIYVCIGEWKENESVMIGTGIGEVVASNLGVSDNMAVVPRQAANAVFVKAENDGIVEVLRWD